MKGKPQNMLKTIIFLPIFIFEVAFGQVQKANERVERKPIDKIIFVAGTTLNKVLINYVATLTNKPNPKICYIPTASGDFSWGGIVSVLLSIFDFRWRLCNRRLQIST